MPELAKAYEPQPVESKWYQYWVDQNFFTADPARVSAKRPAYSIVIPPPNVTGVLTMGHVLNNTIQDILARKARMDGKEVLWQPGIDHAGIATEGVVSRQLRKEEHKTKQDLGREEFLKRVWQWKEKHGGIILQQLKALGASCDWSRTRFTMDDDYVRCVMKVFVDLYKKGLIYRGKRMVNWCPATQTALSDEEVVMKEQKGFMYHFKVQVAEKVGQASRLPGAEGAEENNDANAARSPDGRDARPALDGVRLTDVWLPIATTRPETIPGDTAVAVNPKDPRYTHLIGKHVLRPLPPELPRERKLIPIVADEHVDFEFGTGVLKVTPAHDKADFEIGQRHKLPVVEVIEADGKMNALAGQDLNGLDRFAARKIAVEKLKEIGALEKEEPYTNNVGFSERADVPIEPRLSEQWFLKYPSVEHAKNCVAQDDEGSTRAPRVAVGALADSTERVTRPARSDSSTLPDAVDEASAATRGARVLPEPMRFYPQRWAKVYDHWMGGIQDWCISRQLWWGHRIPVWHGWASNIDYAFFKAANSKGFEKGKIEYSLEGSTESDPTLREVEHVRAEYIESEKKWYVWHCVNPGFEHIEKKLEADGYTQDPDVLDTWFSSWLWPFATMGWTGDKAQDSNNPTLQAFYPTTDLVTGPDIIFFWVARMIMAGYEYMGDLPFRNVYFTGIIRDKQGRKMSKSLGNSPDPLDLIAKYGADALRFGVMRAAPLGQDILFDEQNVELGRNFCNKLWNACRFRQMQGGEVQGEIDVNKLRSDDKWILLKLHAAIKELDTAFAEYKFNEATQTLYRFFYSEYCDWYVEATKAVLNKPVEGLKSEELKGAGAESSSTLRPFNPSTPTHPTRANVLAVMDFVLSHTLRLFHPFLPFISEELWHGMGYAEDMPDAQGGRSIMHAPWPKPFDADFRDHYSLDNCYLEFVDSKFDLVSKGRNLRAEARIAANKKVKFILKPAQDLPPNDVEVVKLLLNAEALEIIPDYAPGKGVSSVKAELGELYLPLEGSVDTAAELARLTKELEKISAEVVKVEQKLANPNFTQKVPPEVLAEHRKRHEDWLARKAHVQKAIDGLKG
jgi:valyl-tRNA synthetase